MLNYAVLKYFILEYIIVYIEILKRGDILVGDIPLLHQRDILILLERGDKQTNGQTTQR